MKESVMFVSILAFATPSFTDENLIAQITDGSAWTATMQENRSANFTFNPDGTGQIKFGMLSRKITWMDQDGKFCLDGMPRSPGPNCLVVAKTVSGYDLVGSEGRTLRLSR